MKKHTDYMPDCSGNHGTTPEVGEQFLFHGALIETVSSETKPCDKCASYKLGRAFSEHSICTELPPCSGITFIYRRIVNRKEFKVWQVIRRLDLEDK